MIDRTNCVNPNIAQQNNNIKWCDYQPTHYPHEGYACMTYITGFKISAMLLFLKPYFVKILTFSYKVGKNFKMDYRTRLFKYIKTSQLQDLISIFD